MVIGHVMGIHTSPQLRNGLQWIDDAQAVHEVCWHRLVVHSQQRSDGPGLTAGG
jgi:hypothetical protein